MPNIKNSQKEQFLQNNVTKGYMVLIFLLKELKCIKMLKIDKNYRCPIILWKYFTFN